MSKILNFTRFAKQLFLFIFSIILISHCNPNLQVSQIQICDLFNSRGECKEPWESKKEYHVTLPKNKSIRTWEDLSHHLYFTARETPGLIIRWNREFKHEERDSFMSKSECYGMYKFYGHIGHMEGKEIGSDWMGFFQYLGSILEEERKQSGKWKADFHLNELFPANLELGFYCNNLETWIPLQIDLIVSEVNP